MERVERRMLAEVPWVLVGCAGLIAFLGIWNLTSAARTTDLASLAFQWPIWKLQLVWLAAGVGLAAALCLVDYRHFARFAYPVYGLVILLLVLVLLKGKTALGAQRWLALGPLRMQPSELAKIAVTLALAKFFHDDARPRDGYPLSRLWKPFLMLIVPVALIMKQPDLGTALMVVAVGGSMILFARVRLVGLLVLLVGGMGSAVGAWAFLLKDYQKKRVLAFLDPEGDALGSGYHANQSVIAIGSGQWGGKGWGQGTQSQLSFLPEQHTDFIFSVWAEERGFRGALVLIVLYAVLLLMAVRVGASAKDKFGTFLCVGVTSMLFWQIFVNIGMVTGLLPVVGVTLPLMSYGGSSLLTTLVGLGVLVNVAARKHLF